MAGGRRGPAPQPAEVKKAKGNPGHRPLLTEQMEAQARAADALPFTGTGAGSANGAGLAGSPSFGEGGTQAETAAPSLAMQPPEWLNADGLEIWHRLAPRLVVMKILQNLDADAFARYCQNFGRWVKLQRRLDKEGETYESESPHGKYIRSNPAFMIADRLDRALERAEANFALNPADRQRLFAARAAAALGGGGDLFGNGGSDKPAAGDQVNDPARPKSPVGYLMN